MANTTAVLAEESWNPITWNEAAASTRVFAVYMASKALSEKAAWGYHHTVKPHYDLVTFCPAFIFGPPVDTQPPATTTDIPSTLKLFYEALTGAGGLPGGPTSGGSLIDVRDLAHAYVLALHCEAAGNERFLLSGGMFVNAEVAELNPHVKRVEWSPIKDTVDCSKAKRVLGFEPRDKRVTICDTAAVLLSLVPLA